MRSYNETTLQSVVSLQVLLGMADSVSGDVRQSLWACHVECSVLNKLTLLTYQYETKQEEG